MLNPVVFLALSALWFVKSTALPKLYTSFDLAIFQLLLSSTFKPTHALMDIVFSNC